jgi:hypothetical protein
VVDAADYVVWRDRLGQNVALPNRDQNNNGPISNADYNSWRTNFGRTSLGAGSLSSSPVPEPSVLAMLLIAMVGFFVRRYRARNSV